jgi:hypothetical protein
MTTEQWPDAAPAMPQLSAHGTLFRIDRDTLHFADGSCRPATEPEKAMWRMLMAQPAKNGAAVASAQPDMQGARIDARGVAPTPEPSYPQRWQFPGVPVDPQPAGVAGTVAARDTNMLHSLADALESWGKHDDGPLRTIPALEAAALLRKLAPGVNAVVEASDGGPNNG